MGRRKLQVPSRQKPPYLRRATLLFLALTYLFVGLGHVAFCTEEAIAATVASDIGAASSNGSEDGDSTKAPVVAEHCPICAPVLIPAPMLVASRMEQPVKIAFIVSRRLLEDYSKLDTPPPKHLS